MCVFTISGYNFNYCLLSWFSNCGRIQESWLCCLMITKIEPGDVWTPATSLTNQSFISGLSFQNTEALSSWILWNAFSYLSKSIFLIAFLLPNPLEQHFWKSLRELCNIRLHFKGSNSEEICEICIPRYLKFWAIWQFSISLAALGETSSNKKALDKLQLIFNPESFPKSCF